MELIRRYGRSGGRLCVLGAGNANDLDLAALARRFRAVHLVDLDADALARAAARQRVADQPQLVIHAPVDVTGLLDHLSPLALTEPDRLADRVERVETSPPDLGLGRFDLVVSTGPLTQLLSTVVELGFEPLSVARSIVALGGQHLRLMSQLATAAGACLLVTELASSTTAPGLIMMGQDELRRCVPGLLADWNFFTGTHPEAIVLSLRAEGTGSGPPAWVEPIAPWLWRLGQTRAYLAFAIAWGMRGPGLPTGRDGRHQA